MTITWLGHACFMLESGGCRIILDPCKGVPGVPNTCGEAQAVFCSHDHFDHCYTDEIRISDSPVFPFAVREVESFHDDAQGEKRGRNTIRVITAEDTTVVHLGDLGHILSPEQVNAIGTCDVLLLPVGGTYTLNAAEARQVAEQLAPRLICPMHYRRGEMGFDVLQTVDEFTSQFAADCTYSIDSNHLALTEDVLREGGIAVLTL